MRISFHKPTIRLAISSKPEKLVISCIPTEQTAGRIGKELEVLSSRTLERDISVKIKIGENLILEGTARRGEWQKDTSPLITVTANHAPTAKKNPFDYSNWTIQYCLNPSSGESRKEIQHASERSKEIQTYSVNGDSVNMNFSGIDETFYGVDRRIKDTMSARDSVALSALKKDHKPKRFLEAIFLMQDPLIDRQRLFEAILNQDPRSIRVALRRIFKPLLEEALCVGATSMALFGPFSGGTDIMRRVLGMGLVASGYMIARIKFSGLANSFKIGDRKILLEAAETAKPLKLLFFDFGSIKTKDEKTPLMIAAMIGADNIVEALKCLGFGANSESVKIHVKESLAELEKNYADRSGPILSQTYPLRRISHILGGKKGIELPSLGEPVLPKPLVDFLS